MVLCDLQCTNRLLHLPGDRGTDAGWCSKEKPPATNQTGWQISLKLGGVVPPPRHCPPHFKLTYQAVENVAGPSEAARGRVGRLGRLSPSCQRGGRAAGTEGTPYLSPLRQLGLGWQPRSWAAGRSGSTRHPHPRGAPCRCSPFTSRCCGRCSRLRSCRQRWARRHPAACAGSTSKASAYLQLHHLPAAEFPLLLWPR